MSMDRKKSKYLSETKFWVVGSLKAEKTRGGHNGPPLCGYVIPDPMWNRVKPLNLLLRSISIRIAYFLNKNWKLIFFNELEWKRFFRTVLSR